MTTSANDSSAPRLGRWAISVMIEWLEFNKTNSQLVQLLFRHGLNDRYTGPNILSRLGNVFHPLVLNDADEAELESARVVFEEIVDEFSRADAWGAVHAKRDEFYKSFQQALRVEGLDLVEGKIVPFLSPSVEPEQEQGVLESRLERWGFTVASNHLNNSADLAAIGKWEPANGEVRNFLEGVCDAITATIYSAAGKVPTRGQARQFLTDQNFLSPKESELLKSLFQVLHGEGGHAGTSSSDDCHRRRLMAVSMANYYLERLDQWVSETSL